MTDPHQCRICGSETGSILQVKERMFGTGKVFDYFQCHTCECVQIVEIPENLEDFYPPNYYSFRPPRVSISSEAKKAARVLAIRTPGLPRLLQDWLAERDSLFHIAKLIRDACGGTDASILDVGSGAGNYLRLLVDAGFRNVLGIDAYLSDDIHYRNRILIKKADLFSKKGNYDLISFNHSFEHMPHQQEVLQCARTLLTTDGCIVARIPIVGGEAWEAYREDWVQFDAPRHLYLHSLKSFGHLAADSGLRLERIIYDSNQFQFWGSELYRRNIPLSAFQWPPRGGTAPLFTRQEMTAFAQRAREANRGQRGDQIAAILRKSTD
jgi:SAM-dependent methyltransferase